MLKPAFSTVACPDWTLAKIASRLEAWGFLGMELRTFGNGSAQFACDPALTAPTKVRGYARAAGMDICSLATSVGFDEPVTPPVIGNVISDTEKAVRQAKSAVDLAIKLECPFVRVFGFELPSGETRSSGVARVAARLGKVADYCRNSGVQVMIENGGSFNSAKDLAELMDSVGSQSLVACYSIPVGRAAGDSVVDAMRVLGNRLVMTKVKDIKGTQPVALGQGELQALADVRSLARSGFDGWCVYEFDRAWLAPGMQVDTDAVLQTSAQAMFQTLGEVTGTSGAQRVHVRSR